MKQLLRETVIALIAVVPVVHAQDGLTYTTYTSFSQGIGPTAFKFATVDVDAFVQDNWHVNPKTTLNLGLRYDYERMPKPQIANPLLPASSCRDGNHFSAHVRRAGCLGF